jgi:hypothetical protein
MDVLINVVVMLVLALLLMQFIEWPADLAEPPEEGELNQWQKFLKAVKVGVISVAYHEYKLPSGAEYTTLEWNDAANGMTVTMLDCDLTLEEVLEVVQQNVVESFAVTHFINLEVQAFYIASPNNK